MNFMRPIMVFFAALLMMTAQTSADTTSLRCGNGLVSLGDTRYKVRKICGDPAYEKPIGERKRYRILEKERLRIEDITYLTEWAYERRQGHYILVFEGSRLVHKEFSR